MTKFNLANETKQFIIKWKEENWDLKREEPPFLKKVSQLLTDYEISKQTNWFSIPIELRLKQTELSDLQKIIIGTNQINKEIEKLKEIDKELVALKIRKQKISNINESLIPGMVESLISEIAEEILEKEGEAKELKVFYPSIGKRHRPVEYSFNHLLEETYSVFKNKEVKPLWESISVTIKYLLIKKLVKLSDFKDLIPETDQEIQKFFHSKLEIVSLKQTLKDLKKKTK